MSNNVPGAYTYTLYDLQENKHSFVGDLYLIGFNSPFTNIYYFLTIKQIDIFAMDKPVDIKPEQWLPIYDAVGNTFDRKPKNFEQTSFPHLATLFVNYEDAKNAAIKLVNLFEANADESLPKFNPDILQVKNICERYYNITHYTHQHSLEIAKRWLHNPMDYEENNLLNSERIHVCHYFFPLEEYDRFVEKLRDIKIDCINGLQEKILKIGSKKPETLLAS